MLQKGEPYSLFLSIFNINAVTEGNFWCITLNLFSDGTSETHGPYSGKIKSFGCKIKTNVIWNSFLYHMESQDF